MQTLEAIISFTVFMFFSSGVLLEISDEGKVDDSLYRYQLANDVWRVLYLQKDFEDFSFDSSSPKRDAVQEHLTEIYDKTKICAYLGGIKATSCDSSTSCRADISSVQHVLLENDVLSLRSEAKSVTLTLCTPES